MADRRKATNAYYAAKLLMKVLIKYIFSSSLRGPRTPIAPWIIYRQVANESHFIVIFAAENGQTRAAAYAPGLTCVPGRPRRTAHGGTSYKTMEQ